MGKLTVNGPCSQMVSYTYQNLYILYKFINYLFAWIESRPSTSLEIMFVFFHWEIIPFYGRTIRVSELLQFTQIFILELPNETDELPYWCKGLPESNK